MICKGENNTPPNDVATKDKPAGITPDKPRIPETYPAGESDVSAPIEDGTSDVIDVVIKGGDGLPDIIIGAVKDAVTGDGTGGGGDAGGGGGGAGGGGGGAGGSVTATYSTESIDALINDIAGITNPCDAIGEFFEELADKIDELKDKFDELIDKFVDKTSNVLGIPAVLVRWVVDYALIRIGIRRDFQSESVFRTAAGIFTGSSGSGSSGGAPPIGGGPSFIDELRALYQLGLDTQAFAIEVERIKRRWGGFDPDIDTILNDPSRYIRNLGSDLERLCNLIPNWETAKNGSAKVTSPSFGLGFPIDLIEILEEGPSPWITRLLDITGILEFSGLEAHQHYDKITDESDGFCSWGDL